MLDTMIFADRLQEQMTLRGYDTKRLAEAIGVSVSTIYNFLQGRYTQPDTNIFFDLIEHFDCSADYMLGLTEFPEDVSYFPPLRTYGTRLRELLKTHNLTQQAFIEQMKISSNLVHKWLSNQTLPTVEYLIKLSNFFEITVDALIQRTK